MIVCAWEFSFIGIYRFQHDDPSSCFDTACDLCDSPDGTLRVDVVDPPGTICGEEDDTWVCVVCGFVGCGASRCNHILLHYESHLHAYAMNTVTKRVWDFAGNAGVGPDDCMLLLYACCYPQERVMSTDLSCTDQMIAPVHSTRARRARR